MFSDPHAPRFDPNFQSPSVTKAPPSGPIGNSPLRTEPTSPMYCARVEGFVTAHTRAGKLKEYAQNLAQHDLASGLCTAEGVDARAAAWNKLLLLVDTDRFEKIFYALDLLSTRDAQKIRKAIAAFPEAVRNYEEVVSEVYLLGLDRSLISFFEPTRKVDGRNAWVPFHVRIIERVEVICSLMRTSGSSVSLDPSFTLFTHNLNILCESLLDRQLEPHKKPHPVFELRRFARILDSVAKREDSNDQILYALIDSASMILSDGLWGTKGGVTSWGRVAQITFFRRNVLHIFNRFYRTPCRSPSSPQLKTVHLHDEVASPAEKLWFEVASITPAPDHSTVRHFFALRKAFTKIFSCLGIEDLGIGLTELRGLRELIIATPCDKRIQLLTRLAQCKASGTELIMSSDEGEVVWSKDGMQTRYSIVPYLLTLVGLDFIGVDEVSKIIRCSRDNTQVLARAKIVDYSRQFLVLVARFAAFFDEKIKRANVKLGIQERREHKKLMARTVKALLDGRAEFSRSRESAVQIIEACMEIFLRRLSPEKSCYQLSNGALAALEQGVLMRDESRKLKRVDPVRSQSLAHHANLLFCAIRHRYTAPRYLELVAILKDPAVSLQGSEITDLANPNLDNIVAAMRSAAKRAVVPSASSSPPKQDLVTPVTRVATNTGGDATATLITSALSIIEAGAAYCDEAKIPLAKGYLTEVCQSPGLEPLSKTIGLLVRIDAEGALVELCCALATIKQKQSESYAALVVNGPALSCLAKLWIVAHADDDRRAQYALQAAEKFSTLLQAAAEGTARARALREMAQFEISGKMNQAQASPPSQRIDPSPEASCNKIPSHFIERIVIISGHRRSVSPECLSELFPGRRIEVEVRGLNNCRNPDISIRPNDLVIFTKFKRHDFGGRVLASVRAARAEYAHHHCGHIDSTVRRVITSSPPAHC
jgi:hypothetical protein